MHGSFHGDEGYIVVMLGSTVRTTYVKTFVSSHCIDLALFVFTAAGSDKVEVKDQQTQTVWSMTKEQGVQATVCKVF